jgi:hypothetical protein
VGTDPDLGPYSFLDGTLQLWINDWLVLRDHASDVIEGRYRGKEETIVIGSKIIFDGHFARIMRSDLSPPEVCGLVLSIPDLNWVWKISYSTFKDLDRGRMKAYDGTLILLAAEKLLILKNAKGDPVAVQAVRSDPVSKVSVSYSVGSKIRFQLHSVRIGKCLASPPVQNHVLSLSNANASPSSVSSADHVDSDAQKLAGPGLDTCDSTNDIPSTMFDSLSMGLDFTYGIYFAKHVRKRFLSNVHSSRDSEHFTLVVSFGRANFRISEDSVGIALEAAIGGFCGSLKVSTLSERVFSFVVSSKQVGFYILNHRYYACPQFKFYFHLWGLGGPNWLREFNLWQKECKEEL